MFPGSSRPVVTKITKGFRLEIPPEALELLKRQAGKMPTSVVFAHDGSQLSISAQPVVVEPTANKKNLAVSAKVVGAKTQKTKEAKKSGQEALNLST